MTEPVLPEKVGRGLGLSVPEVLPLLVSLEMKGLVRNIGGRFEPRLETRGGEPQPSLAWLGVNNQPTMGDMSLQDAMPFILRERGNTGMRAPALAREINARRLYRMRDGRPVDPHQVHARVHNYPGIFVRDAGLIRLRED